MEIDLAGVTGWMNTEKRLSQLRTESTLRCGRLHDH